MAKTALSKSNRKSDLEIYIATKASAIDAILPPDMRGQTDRLIKRAVLTVWNGTPQLRQCTKESILMSVLQAAEHGLAIDGKLGHAVPYKSGKGYEAHFQPDYKGLIAVAKRTGIIQDCWARVVCEHDHFTCVEVDAKTKYQFDRDWDNPGPPRLAFAVATHTDGWYRVEVMTKADIEAIRNRSQAWKSGGTSPWKTDEMEMWKKTVLRQLLKTFSDDPGLVNLFDTEDDPGVTPRYEAQPISGLDELTARIQEPDTTPRPEEFIKYREDTPAPVDLETQVANAASNEELKKIVGDNPDLPEGEQTILFNQIEARERELLEGES